MAIPTPPTGSVKFADNLLANGPLGGPSRKDPAVQKQDSGWAFAEKPDYSTFNGWMYNVYQKLDWAEAAILQLETDIGGITGTPDATELIKGKERIATQAEANAFNVGNQILTPNKMLGAWNTIFDGFGGSGKQVQISSGSLNDYLKNSVYSVDAGNVSDCPTSLAGDWFFVRTFGYATDDFATQMAYGMSGTTALNTVWYRTRSGGSWGGWFQVGLSGSNLGDVVTETFITVTVAATIVNIVGSANAASFGRTGLGSYNMTFTEAFPDTQYVIDITVAEESDNKGRNASISYNSKTTTGFSFQINGVADGAHQDPSLIDVTVSRRKS